MAGQGVPAAPPTGALVRARRCGPKQYVLRRPVVLDEIHVDRSDAAWRVAEVSGQTHALQKHLGQDYR